LKIQTGQLKRSAVLLDESVGAKAASTLPPLRLGPSSPLNLAC
jgi:hypothetical protein